jgi:hypothetical protein
VHRALRRWTEQREQPELRARWLPVPQGRWLPVRQGRVPVQPELRGQVPVPWATEPGELPDRARGLKDAPLPPERLPWARRPVLMPWQQHRGRRCAVYAQRGPQWWKRRSERIRPVPAVLSLHLWK